MKRCPKCNRAYATDTQKFCTHDGGLLFMVDESLTETVQFDSAKVRDKVSHPTTRDLGEQKPTTFDPEATVVTPAPAQGTQPPRARDTGSLEPPHQTQYYGVPASGPASGPVSPPAPTMVSSVPPPASPPQPPPPPAPTSGPIAQPPGPPASAQTPSGPIAVPSVAIPASAAQAAAVSAQPSQPLAAAPAQKKSKLPLILGIAAVVLVLFVGGAAAAGYFLVIKPRQEAKAAQRAAATEPAQTVPAPLTSATPAEAPSPANEPPPYNPPADATQFVNSKDGLNDKLAENFVAFSFYYPNRWMKVPGTENFVKVERRLPPDFTQENFAVAPWYAPAGVTSFDSAFFQTLVEKDDANFARNYPEYRKVSEGPTKVGSYDGYELRFESISRGTDKGDLTIWGREIFFPPRKG